MIQLTEFESFQLDALPENRMKSINHEFTIDELELAETPPKLSPQVCVVVGQISWKQKDNLLGEFQAAETVKELLQNSGYLRKSVGSCTRADFSSGLVLLPTFEIHKCKTKHLPASIKKNLPEPNHDMLRRYSYDLEGQDIARFRLLPETEKDRIFSKSAISREISLRL